jgi:hypothetical protein
MEYLMTYGWAILIIAVVLGVLFQMGVFNSSSVTVRVPPGACKVLRTSAAVNLVGQCSGILPKYVAQFDGQSSYINIGTSSGVITGNQATFEVWADVLGAGNAAPRGIMFGQGATYFDTCYLTVSPLFSVGTTHGQLLAYGGSCPAIGQWTQYAGTYNGVTATLYVNGVSVNTIPQTGNLISAQAAIGRFIGGSFNFNGLIANAQIYNTSLDASSIATLYQEGMGGVPVNPQSLVGWWPLNGDTKDYSGNNNGAPTAITFTAQYGK